MIDDGSCVPNAVVAFPETFNWVFFHQPVQLINDALVIFNRLITQAAAT
jgi:hypothetical protein